jgi:putative membrane protein
VTAIRMALGELRRLTAGRLPKLAALALLLIPTLYGGLYLYANHDPYGRLDKVPAAVVVEDAGTTLSTGEVLSVGPQVADDLLASHTFDWHKVDRTEADAGVADGRYAFALTLPATFSADLASSAEFDPRQANLELTTNDANNYLAHTIANQVVAEVTKSVAAKVSETAASKLLAGFATIHDQVEQAAAGAAQLETGLGQAVAGSARLQTGATQLVAGQQKLATGAGQLYTGTTQAAAGAAQLATGARQLSSGLGTLKTKAASLPADTRKLANGADQVADGNEQVAAVGDDVATASSTLVSDLSTLDSELAQRLRDRGLTEDQVRVVLAETAKLRTPVVSADKRIQTASKQLDQLAVGARLVANGNEKLADATPALTQGIGSAATGASTLSTGATQLSTGVTALQTGAKQLRDGEVQAVAGQQRLAAGATSLHDGLVKLSTGATRLRTGLDKGLKQIPDPSPEARKAVAQTLGAPIAVQNTSQATAGSYGAGLAPFFMCLACWIGAYVLFLLVRPLSPRALAATQWPLRIALGGWLPPAVFGVIQATLLFGAVIIGLGIDTAHPWLTVGLLMLTSMAFVAILHALAAWLGSIGKFLGLVLMVIQLVSAGGTFPWQTIPGPLYVFHHALPMSYAIDGVRHLMYGGATAGVAGDALVLLGYLVAALGASALAARKQRVWSAKKLQPELVL